MRHEFRKQHAVPEGIPQGFQKTRNVLVADYQVEVAIGLQNLKLLLGPAFMTDCCCSSM